MGGHPLLSCDPHPWVMCILLPVFQEALSPANSFCHSTLSEFFVFFCFLLLWFFGGNFLIFTGNFFDLEISHILSQFLRLFVKFLSPLDLLANRLHDFGIVAFTKSNQNASNYSCRPQPVKFFSKFSPAEKCASQGYSRRNLPAAYGFLRCFCCVNWRFPCLFLVFLVLCFF